MTVREFQVGTQREKFRTLLLRCWITYDANSSLFVALASHRIAFTGFCPTDEVEDIFAVKEVGFALPIVARRGILA